MNMFFHVKKTKMMKDALPTTSLILMEIDNKVIVHLIEAESNRTFSIRLTKSHLQRPIQDS